MSNKTNNRTHSGRTTHPSQSRHNELAGPLRTGFGLGFVLGLLLAATQAFAVPTAQGATVSTQVTLVHPSQVPGGAAEAVSSFFDSIVERVQGGDGEVIELVLPMPVPTAAPFEDHVVANASVSYDADTDQVTFSGSYDVLGRQWTTTIEMTETTDGFDTSIHVAIAQMGIGDAVEAVADYAGVTFNNPFEGMVELSDVNLYVEVAEQVSVSMSAHATVMNGINADVLVSVSETAAGQAVPMVSLHVANTTIGQVVPAAAGTPLGSIGFPDVTWTVVDFESSEYGTAITADELDPAARAFYARVYGSDNFTLELEPGINFAADMPMNHLPAAVLTVLNLDPQDHALFAGSVEMNPGWINGPADVQSVHISATLPIPNVDPPGLPAWLDTPDLVQRSIDFTYEDGDVTLHVNDIVEAYFDDADRLFVLSTDIATAGESAEVTVQGAMAEPWVQPFGIDWLTLDAVSLTVAASNEQLSAALQSSFEIGSVAVDLDIDITDEDGERTATITAEVDSLSIDDLIELVELQGLETPFDGFPLDVALTDINMTLQAGAQQSFTLTGAINILNQQTTLLMSTMRVDGQPQIMAGFRVDAFSLGAVLPPLAGTMVDELNFDGTAVVLTRGDGDVESSDLSAPARAFYADIYGSDDFELSMQPGVNLIGSAPMEGNPLTGLMTAMGAGVERIVLQGTVPAGILSGDGAPNMSDLFLRADLPPVSPEGAPEWFVSGQLAIEITGQPSAGLVGELTVDIDGDILTFFVESNIAVNAGSVEVALVGGLSAEQPWEAPLGIDWLTFNSTTLVLSFDTFANVSLGFAADVMIGEKDIMVAALLSINAATGVPTNLIFEGQSDEGIALSDLAELQSRMSAATGQPVLIPLDQLPDIALRSLHLKFALFNEPNLNIEQGFALSAELFMAKEFGGEMELIASIDMSVDTSGIYGDVFLGAFDVGAFSFDDAQLLLNLSATEQQFRISGGIVLGDLLSADIDLDITKDNLSFETSTTVFGQFQAEVYAEKSFSFSDPGLHVEVQLSGEFIGQITTAIGGGVSTAINAANVGIDGLQVTITAGLNGADAALQVAQAALDVGLNAAASAEVCKNAAWSARNSALSARNAAYSLWYNTSNWSWALKAARWVDYAAKHAVFIGAAAFYETKNVAHAAAVAALTGLNAAVEQAAANVDAAQAQLAAQFAELDALQAQVAALGDLATSLDVDYIGFSMERDGFVGSGSDVNLELDGSIAGMSFSLDIGWDFGASIQENIPELIASLTGA